MRIATIQADALAMLIEIIAIPEIIEIIGIITIPRITQLTELQLMLATHPNIQVQRTTRAITQKPSMMITVAT